MSTIIMKDGDKVVIYTLKNGEIVPVEKTLSMPLWCSGCKDFMAFGGGTLCLQSLDKPSRTNCPKWDDWEEEYGIHNAE